VLDGIEQLSEVSRGIGSADFCHKIRLSDLGVGGPTQRICNLALAADTVNETLNRHGSRFIRRRRDDARA
jgi:hypothetical protein